MKKQNMDIIKSHIMTKKIQLEKIEKELIDKANGVQHYAEKRSFEWARINAEEVSKLSVKFQALKRAIEEMEAMVSFLEKEEADEDQEYQDYLEREKREAHLTIYDDAYDHESEEK